MVSTINLTPTQISRLQSFTQAEAEARGLVAKKGAVFTPEAFQSLKGIDVSEAKGGIEVPTGKRGRRRRPSTDLSDIDRTPRPLSEGFTIRGRRATSFRQRFTRAERPTPPPTPTIEQPSAAPSGLVGGGLATQEQVLSRRPTTLPSDLIIGTGFGVGAPRPPTTFALRREETERRTRELAARPPLPEAISPPSASV